MHIQKRHYVKDGQMAGARADTSSQIDILHDDIFVGAEEQATIEKHLLSSDKYNVSRVCKRFHSLFKDPAAQYVCQFLRHAIQGEEVSVLAMLEKTPSLLLEMGTVVDYTNRTFAKLTVFELLISAGDTDMLTKVIPFFDRLPHGQEEKVRQFRAQFPDGIVKQVPYNFDNLVTVITQSSNADIHAALAKQQDNSPLCQALNQFREAFTLCSHKEKIFNPQHLLKAFAIYKDQFESWDWGQRDLFLRQVIGFVQRFLPSCYAQAFGQGLYNLLVKNPADSLKREFNFAQSEDHFFPLGAEPSSGLGFDFAVGQQWGGISTGRWLGQDLDLFQRYVEQKHLVLQALDADCRIQHAERMGIPTVG